ncbi:protein Asterix-like [Tripterygium wilfordii]|uniref:protein Asterix-like n=1 Tax=Tripterygium wilfordii TaxID=458696 RepID=UPI0018F7E54C|nr:protein Asterix-like [Tripterygium wilfordii]
MKIEPSSRPKVSEFHDKYQYIITVGAHGLLKIKPSSRPMVSEFRNKFRYFLEIRVNSIHSRVMASHGNSSSANDPRQPSTARPYVAPLISTQDLPIDYYGFIAVVFGVVGVMFRYELSSWLAIVFCAESLANMRNMETDLKQISMAMMFAIMGLVTKYMGLARPGMKG